MVALGLAFGLVFLLILIGIIILQFAGMWKTFEKAGKPGWAAIIPVYNYIVIAEISGKPAWWGAMVLVPIANIVFIIWLLNVMVKSFAKDEGYTIGLIFLPFIFWPILGFSKDIRYQGPFCKPDQNNYMNQQINNLGNQGAQNESTQNRV